CSRACSSPSALPPEPQGPYRNKTQRSATTPQSLPVLRRPSTFLVSGQKHDRPYRRANPSSRRSHRCLTISRRPSRSSSPVTYRGRARLESETYLPPIACRASLRSSALAHTYSKVPLRPPSWTHRRGLSGGPWCLYPRPDSGYLRPAPLRACMPQPSAAGAPSQSHRRCSNRASLCEAGLALRVQRARRVQAGLRLFAPTLTLLDPLLHKCRCRFLHRNPL